MDLRANAIITAIDRFSGPVRAMAGSLGAFGTVGARAGAVAGKVGRGLANVATGVGVPASLFGGMAMRGEYDIDRIARQMESVGDLTEAQRHMLTEHAFRSSRIVGEGADDLLKAQRELIQGGLDPETTALMTTLMGKAAKSNAMAISQVAEDAINVSRGLSMPFDTMDERVRALTKSLEFMSVVPSLSTETWEGLRESLKYSAPVAGALKMKITDLGSALSILADKGFKGEEGGTAFRTIMLRAIAPTKALTQAYRAAGVQVEGLYDLNQAMIADMPRLKERLLGANFTDDGSLDETLKSFGDPSKFDGLYAYADALKKSLAEKFGIESGDAQSKGILGKAIDQHIFSAIQGFDLKKLFAELSKLPLSDFSKVAGIQRTAQAMALRDDMRRFDPLASEFEKRMPGAVDRRFGVMDEGFSQSIDRMMASFATLRHAFFESGFATQLASLFEGMASSVQVMARISPDVLNWGAWGVVLTGLAGAISLIASSPIAAAAAGLTGLAVLMGNIDPQKGVLGHMFGSGESATTGDDKKSWFEEAVDWSDARNKAIIEGRSPSLMNYMFGGFKPPEMDAPADRFGFGGGMVRDLAPTAGPAAIDITGRVDANVTGQASISLDNQIRIIAPEGFQAYVEKRGQGTATVPLNTGKSMPDTGK